MNNKSRKTSHISNIIQFDAEGHVVIPASLTLGIAPGADDNSAKVPSTAWVRGIITTAGGAYVPTGRTLTINGVSFDLSANRSWSIDTGVLTASAGSGISVSTVNQNLNIVNTGLLTGSAGAGISVTTVNQNLNIVNTGLLSATSGAGISVTTVNQNLNIVNTGILTASSGLGISVTTVGQNLNIVNTGLLTGSSGAGISVTTVGQNLNIVNTGILTATAGAGISLTVVDGNLNIVNTITNNNQLTNGAGYATTSFVTTQINNLVAGAPGLLDTLDELAAALGDDPNFATTISTALGNRLRIDINNQGLNSTQQANGRTNLGLGSLAILSSIGDAQITDVAWSKVTGAPAFITGNQTITLSGDATGSGATSIAVTLANSGVTAGTYGSSTAVPVITVDAKGRVTNVTVASISGSLTFTGDVTGSGTTGSSTTLTLANSGVTAGTYTKVTVDAKGRVTVGASLAAGDLPSHTHDDRYYTETEINNFFSGASAISGYNKSNWDTAFGWGNHASAGYLTTSSAASTYVSLTGSYANPSWITSLAYSKITGVPAFLTSYTETDPFRVTAVAVSGSSTKTITITRADNSTVTTTWTDIDTDTNTFVTSAAFSGGTLTLTRNDAGTVSVSLDGRYYLASNPSGYITGITSSMVTSALGFTPYNSTNPNGYISQSTADGRYLMGTTSPSSVGNFTLSIGNNGSYSYVQSHSSQPLELNPVGNAVRIAGNVVWHQGNLTNLNQLSNGPGYITSSGSISGNAATTSQRSFSGDISTDGMGRFTGWYTGTAATTLATEVGVSSGLGYIIVYNRQTSTYGTLNLNAVNINIDPQGGIATVGGSQIVTNNGGTWSINITGGAGSVSGLTLNNINSPINPDNVTQNQLGYNTSVNLFGQTDGGLYSSAYSSNWIHQIYGDFRSGQIAIRGKQNGTWQSWRTVLDSSNYSSYALPLSGGTIATNGYIDFGPNSTWGSTLRVGGNGHTGTSRASVCTTNGNLHLDGGTTGGGGGIYLNAYHNGPIYATTSQHLVLHAGNYNSYSPTLTGGNASGTWGISITGNAQSSTTTTHLSSRTDGAWYNVIWGAGSPSYLYSSDSVRILSSEGALRANIYYDNQDTAYYLNPAGGSRLRNLYVGDSGDDWSDPGGWGTQVRFSNGPHVRFVLHARTPGIEAGMYVHTPGSVFIGSYTGHDVSMMWAGSRRIHITGSYVYTDVYLEAAGSMRAPIFYDSNDTGYYGDFAGTSRMNNIILGSAYSPSYQGQLVLGHTSYNFNFLNGSWASSITAGILANCADEFEFAIHDSGNSVESLFIYSGGRILMGRSIGWGTTYIEAAESFRAPIFYDSNDAGYWLDPNGSTSLYVAGKLETTRSSGTMFSHGSMTDAIGYNGSYGTYIGSVVGGTYYIYGNGTFFDNGTIRTFIHSGNIGGQSVNYATQAGTASNANTVGGFGAGSFFRDLGFEGGGSNANTISESRSAFTYAVNAPHSGPLAYFGASGYGLQLNALYHGGGNNISYRTRNGDNGTWNSWREFITTGNIASQSVSYANTAGSASSATFLNSSNYINRCGSSGNANTDFQNTPAGSVRHNGDDANLSNSPGGTWWFYDNYRHSNGGNFWGTQVAWGWEDNAHRLATRNISGNSFSGWVYYLNSSNVTSYMDAPNKAGTSYYQTNTWMQMNGTHGIYWPSYYGAHLYVNTTTSYTQFRWDGQKNGYDGVWLSYSSVNGMMYDSGGNGGVYREANGRWYWYHHVGNNCTGISTSTTSSSYRAYIGGSLYAEGDVVAYSDARKKTDIITIDNALEKVTNLRGVYYTRIDDPDRGRQTGVIAQEINEVLPEVVTYAADVDEYGVSYGNIVGVLIEAIKEQQQQIEELKTLVNAFTK